MVGHLLGGLSMLTYANRYPDEVAGVTLVDSSTDSDQFSQRPKARDSQEPQKQRPAVVPQLVRLGVSYSPECVERIFGSSDAAS
jgi:pimeloyl-ACP methyl ester carboxylesterase